MFRNVYWKFCKQVMNGNYLVYLGNKLFEEPLAHLQYAASKPCSLEHRNSFLGSLKWLPELSSHCGVFIYEIFSLLVVYCYLYSLFDTKSTFSFSKIGKCFDFRVNCSIMLEPVPAQPLPLRNIDLSITVLINQHENGSINKATP